MQTRDAVAMATGQGEARWWLGALAEIKATAADTGGSLTLVEVTCGPGYATPLHVHHREDEGFWILEGSATFQVGGMVIKAGVGDFAFGPRDVPHKFSAEHGCRMLFLLTPGGFEKMILATSEPAGSRTLPPIGPPPDFEGLARLVTEFGCELLAPPQ